VIEVKQNSDGISIKGHAHYAEPGKDIVCAGVSTLVQNLVASISGLTIDEIQYDMQPGSVEIKYRNLSEAAQLLVDSFFVGITLIANVYPENVRLVQAVED
jgi:uncharacterized protein YsxB (DUF464 family)